ncbi:hypothetical protein GCM10023143_26860 [Compostibacter hankyongensis]|uniref:SHSP domain-containing protein n=2 Tax=Compostibacter hankyongensis TaxID=1007089 RepID=A0ABP8G1N3_9BACT
MLRTHAHHPVVRSLPGFVEDFFVNNSLPKWLDGDFFRSGSVDIHPPVNIRETKDGFTLDVVAPGLAKEDFKVKLEGDTLLISAEKQTEKEEKTDDKQIRREYSFRSFKRAFTLTESVDTAGINAAYENGVLKVTLPKKEDQVEASKEITVG